MKSFVCLLLIFVTQLLFFIAPSSACTIVSGIDCNGHVWNANNEDGPSGVANFINVFPKTPDNQYGYYTLSYLSPEYGNGGNIQGGMNEAGLTFDFNAINPVEGFDPQTKQAFPKGDDAILPHILANMRSVQEVIDFFNTYWFQNGFTSVQMHVADSTGRFAIISASGTQLVEKGKSLVSTNFDICGKADGSSCWRYPIATQKLSERGASLSTMLAICRETAQKNGGTMYSNVQNLTTGEMWFFSKHDPGIIVSTNLEALLAKGQNSYTFSDLRSLNEEQPDEPWKEPNTVTVAESTRDQYVGTYKNPFIGEMVISPHEDGIHLASPFAPSEVLYAQSESTFYLPDTGFSIEFRTEENGNQKTMRFLENGYWSFSAWKNDRAAGN